MSNLNQYEKDFFHFSNSFNNILAITTASSAFLSRLSDMHHGSVEATRPDMMPTDASLTNLSLSKSLPSSVITLVFAIA